MNNALTKIAQRIEETELAIRRLRELGQDHQGEVKIMVEFDHFTTPKKIELTLPKKILMNNSFKDLALALDKYCTDTKRELAEKLLDKP